MNFMDGRINKNIQKYNSMNFDQLKIGDTLFFGFLSEDEGFVRHSVVKSIRDMGYIQIMDNCGNEFIVYANERKSTISDNNGNVVSTNEQQTVKWVERKLKKRVMDAKKLYNSREMALMDFRSKHKLENK